MAPVPTFYGEFIMDDVAVHPCQCPLCAAGTDHPERQLHRQLNRVLHRLDEQQRRWVAGLESKKMGHGGDTRVALITGLERRPTDRVRRPGAGRPAVKKKLRRSSRT